MRLLPMMACLLFVSIVLPSDAHAARLFSAGGELGIDDGGIEWAVAGGTTAVVSTIKHGGSYSLQMQASLSNFGENIGFLNSAQDDFATVYARTYVYVESYGTGSSAFVVLRNDADTDPFIVRISSTEVDCTYDGNDCAANLAPFATGTWYRLEMFWDSSGAAGGDSLKVRIDGVDVVTRTGLTLSGGVNALDVGHENGPDALSIYFDDEAVNDTSGSSQNSWPGEGKIVAVVPNNTGDSNCTTGNYSMVNEIPPSDTASSGSTMCELDTDGGMSAYFQVADSSTAGIDSYDTITLVYELARMREDTTGATAYQLALESASGGTKSQSSSGDTGDATVRTNPSGTTAFGLSLISYTDPTTGVAWTPTGTNSIDNMQIGVVTTDGSPDVWALGVYGMVEYVDGSASAASGRIMRLFEGFKIKLTSGRIIINQKQ